MDWISIDFAVPPDERDVLVVTSFPWRGANGETRKTRDIYVAKRIVFKNGNVKWRNSHGSGCVATEESATQVTHWMPLPKLPERK